MFFERALELDSCNVEALAGVAMVDLIVGGSLAVDDPRPFMAAAEAKFARALSAAPNHAGAHFGLGFVLSGDACPKPASLPRSSPPTWSATAGSPARTRSARSRGFGRCAATSSTRPSPCITAASSSAPATARSSSSAASSTPCAALSKCRTAWSSATPACRRTAASQFRIGVHLGDVVEEADGDLMGDGVNIAARLEGIAAPGGDLSLGSGLWQVNGRLISRSAILARPSSRTLPADPSLFDDKSASPRSRSRPRRRAHPAARPARQAFHRRTAVPEHERRRRTGILRRRHRRRHHHRTVAHQMAVRDRSQFELHVQGQGRRRAPGRARTGRSVCLEGGMRKAGKSPAHHCAIDRGRNWRACLG